MKRDETRVIVVTVHRNQDGIGCEDDAPQVLDAPTDADLGRALFASLRASSTIRRDLRGAKESDWAAFKASGSRTVRKFKSDFILLELMGANEANLIYEVEGYPEEQSELTVVARAAGAGGAEAFGALVRRVYVACRDRTL